MRILGVDPGTAICGWGIVDRHGSKTVAVAYGAISTPSGVAMEKRLLTIFESITDLIAEQQPHWAAVEKLYFGQNSATALAVGQARGVVLAAVAKSHLNLVEMTPNEVKQTVSGYGMASKGQMQTMVQRLLGLEKKPTPDDVADALAIALTGLEYIRFKGVIHDR